jgi:hypothetical protein
MAAIIHWLRLDPPTSLQQRDDRDSDVGLLRLRESPPQGDAMTSEQAAQLIDETLDLVHQRLQDLQSQALSREQHALAEEFREWRHPVDGHIDLMVFPGLASS